MPRSSGLPPVCGFVHVAPGLRLAVVPSQNFPECAALPQPTAYIFYHGENLIGSTIKERFNLLSHCCGTGHGWHMPGVLENNEFAHRQRLGEVFRGREWHDRILAAVNDPCGETDVAETVLHGCVIRACHEFGGRGPVGSVNDLPGPAAHRVTVGLRFPTQSRRSFDTYESPLWGTSQNFLGKPLPSTTASATPIVPFGAADRHGDVFRPSP